MDISEIVVENAVAVVEGEFCLRERLLQTQSCGESIGIIVEFITCPNRHDFAVDVFHADMGLLCKIVRLKQIKGQGATVILARQEKSVASQEVSRNAHAQSNRYW